MITKKAEYAITALAELARQGKGVKMTTGEIARRKGIPANLIVQLISRLREAGWVISTRGPAGGVELALDPGEVTLKQVIELFDGPIGITRCLLQDGPCNSRTDCRLRGIWAKAQSQMVSVLDGVTIKELSEADTDNSE